MEHGQSNVTGETSSTMKYVMLGVMGLVLVVSVMQAFAINSLTNDLRAGGVSVKGITASAQGGETYEQMMARMHPDQVQPSAVTGAATSGGSGMVGGC